MSKLDRACIEFDKYLTHLVKVSSRACTITVLECKAVEHIENLFGYKVASKINEQLILGKADALMSMYAM